jgi:hypothetical protein
MPQFSFWIDKSKYPCGYWIDSNEYAVQKKQIGMIYTANKQIKAHLPILYTRIRFVVKRQTKAFLQ